MSDIQPNDLMLPSTPPCPLCGGETFLTKMHAAVAKVMEVFRCRKCDVEYPVVKREN